MNNLFSNPEDSTLLEHIEERLSSGRTTCCQWCDIFIPFVVRALSFFFVTTNFFFLNESSLFVLSALLTRWMFEFPIIINTCDAKQEPTRERPRRGDDQRDDRFVVLRHAGGRERVSKQQQQKRLGGEKEAKEREFASVCCCGRRGRGRGGRGFFPHPVFVLETR